MGILVRERPPLALSVCVAPPGGGPSYRWAVDDKRVWNVPDDMVFTTSMPGGFAQFNCTLQRNRHLPWPDEQEFSNLTVLGLGGRTVAWQGRLEQFPDVQGFQAQVNPQASGWQAHLDDDDSAAMVFVDQDLTKWQGPSTQRQINLTSLLTGSTSVSPGGSSLPALSQSLTLPWPAGATTEGWYDAGPSNLIGEIYYNFSSGTIINPADTNWEWFVNVASDSVATASQNTGSLRATSGSGFLTPSVAYRFGFANLVYTAAVASTAGNTEGIFWNNLAVYGNHGLTIQGGAPGGLFASDVIAFTLRKWCPKITYTTGANGTIQPSSFVIPQLVFNTPTTASNIIKQAAQYEILDWAVWELGSGPAAQPAFYLNQLGARGKQWRARVGPAQLQDNGPNVARIWNGVIVQFSNVDGTTSTVGPPGSGAATTSSQLLDFDPTNPANEAGLRRWGIVQMGTSTTAGATQVGAVFLQAQKQLDSSGQASLQGHVRDGSGVWWPSWMVRAGDTITFIDSSSPSTARRIVSTSYSHANRTNTLQLDQPPDATAALLQRLSVVIGPLGFS